MYSLMYNLLKIAVSRILAKIIAKSFCPYGAPRCLYYDSYEFFKCGPQADLRAWRKLAVTFFAQQIQI